jgi:hypothetical protein
MILRVSGKLGKKIGVAPPESLSLHDTPLLDWSGHLFRANRLQYIILTNTATLYSLLFRGRGITTPDAYAERVRAELRTLLTSQGYEDLYVSHIAADDTASFSKAYNRSVIASVNDLVFHATLHIERYGRPLQVAMDRMNRLPMGGLDMTSPERAFQALMSEI